MTLFALSFLDNVKVSELFEGIGLLEKDVLCGLFSD